MTAAFAVFTLFGPTGVFGYPHFIKDMGIALAEAERMNLSLPGLGLAKQLYEAVRAQGYGRKGTQALLLALGSLNAVKR